MKVPPHNPDSEAGVLGSALLEPEVLGWIDLRPEEFFEVRNQILWRTIMDRHLSGRPLDVLMVAEDLKSNGEVEKVGGLERLTELQDFAGVSLHSQQYAENVRRAFKCRQEIGVLSEGIEVAYKGESASEAIVGRLMGIHEDSVRHATDEDIHSAWEKAKDGEMIGIPLPWEKLNTLTGGVMKGVHTVLCGRSGAGKSMLLANWYNHLAGTPFLACPFEDKFVVTKTRMAAALGGYSWGKIHMGKEWVRIGGKWECIRVTRDEIDKAKRALASIPDTTHFFDKRSRPEDLHSIALKHKARHGIEAMFIDGAKDIVRPTGKYNDTGFDEEISQAFCKIAEELNIAVVSVNHLTKIPDGELITTNAIRGSGNIVSDARAVYAFQSKGLSESGHAVQYDENGNQTTRSLDVIKANHCPLGRVILETDLSKCQVWEQR